MLIVLSSIGFLLVTGVCAQLFERSTVGSTRLGAGGAVASCALGLVAGLRALLDGRVESLRLPWSIPYASFFVCLDALSAFFLCLIFGVCGLCALYGAEYLSAGHDHDTGGSWFFFNALVASMAMVVLARNAVLFLVAWEIMSLTSFFLVTSEDEDPSVRRAGWIYLIATHLGTAFLFALFILLGRCSGTLDFDGFGAAALTPHMASLLFLLAVIGYGVKAGFVPFHVWLPEAHPAAPSHVSAVMSGVMIKMGIYGLVRIIPFLGWPRAGWGELLIVLGAFSAVWGILFALCSGHQTAARLLERGKYRDHHDGPRGLDSGRLSGLSRPVDLRARRGAPACAESLRLQESAFFGRGRGGSPIRNEAPGPDGRALEAYALDGRRLSHRRRGGFRTSSAQWFRE